VVRYGEIPAMRVMKRMLILAHDTVDRKAGDSKGLQGGILRLSHNIGSTN
jgi:hypothetical protein